MLARGNSEASARLRRAKSSTSIKTQRSLSMQPSLSDPFPTNEQALAAASYAFGCAAGPDSNSSASQDIATQLGTSDQERPLARSKSIRFAGPNALPRRDLPITLREAPTGQFDHRRSLDPYSRRNNSSIQGDDGITAASPAYSEHVETHANSRLSSSRNLRKSKSMLSPRALSTPTSSTALPPNPSHRIRQIPCAIDRTGQARVHSVSRLQRSFSFLRPHTDYRPANSAYQEEAIGLAQDQYLQQVERQNLENIPWCRDAAVRRRSQKSFRKTVRTSSTTGHGSLREAPRSPTKQRLEHKGIGIKARDLSSSFKNRLKRVFNRSMEVESALPAQHLQATRLHFGGTTAPYASAETQRQSVESLDKGSPDRSGPQPLDPLHVPRRRGSTARHASVGSEDIVIDDNPSRVTSWANSSTPTTLSVHQALGRGQLPIIKEDVVVPLRLGHSRQPTDAQCDAPIAENLARKSSLYVKLQQRMNKSNNKAQLQSPDIEAGGKRIPSVDDLEFPLTDPAETFEVPNRLVIDQDRVYSPKSSTKTCPPAGKVEKRHEPLVRGIGNTMPKGPFHESKTVFFPQKTRIERSRTSPFREAMRHNGPTEKVSVSSDMLSPGRWYEQDIHLSSPTEAENKSVGRSESIYSRTSSGNTPERHERSESLAEVGNCRGSHIALTSFEATAERTQSPSEPVTSKSPANRNGLDAQEWVSEQRLLLDTGESSRSRKGSARVKKRPGHQREHAQITGEETDIGRLHRPDSSSADGLIDFDTYSSIMQTSQAMVDRFPLMSINTQRNTNQNERNVSLSPRAATSHAAGHVDHHTLHQRDRSGENVRPQWSRPTLSSLSSDINLHGIKDRSSRDNRSGLYKNIHTGNTPESQNRCDPERVARLRRMYSSSNLGSPSISRKSDKLPLKLQQDGYREEYQDACEPGITIINRKRNSSSGKLDLSDGRNMVDAFLETRRKAQNDDVRDTVFI